MNYTKYLKRYDKKHGTKGGMIKKEKQKVKTHIKHRRKQIPLSDREARGGGIFDNYKTRY